MSEGYVAAHVDDPIPTEIAPKVKIQLLEKLKAEGPGILNWAVDGFVTANKAVTQNSPVHHRH